jgi:hypothetical protein
MKIISLFKDLLKMLYGVFFPAAAAANDVAASNDVADFAARAFRSEEDKALMDEENERILRDGGEEAERTYAL